MQRTEYFAAALGIAFCAAVASAAEAASSDGEASITVTGTGRVLAKPDEAEIDLAVVTEAQSAAEALDQNNDKANRLHSTLKQHEVADEDIQTIQFSVSPKYQYHRNSDRPPEIVGYTVTNEVHVKVRKLSQLGVLLDAAVGLGANRVQGIRFLVSEREQLLDKARLEAMSDANHKAKLLAKAAPATLLGPVMRIQESGSGPPPRALALREADAAKAAVPISPGQQQLEVQVTVTYRLSAVESPGTVRKRRQ